MANGKARRSTHTNATILRSNAIIYSVASRMIVIELTIYTLRTYNGRVLFCRVDRLRLRLLSIASFSFIICFPFLFLFLSVLARLQSDDAPVQELMMHGTLHCDLIDDKKCRRKNG